MREPSNSSLIASEVLASGRYAIFAGGEQCGEERWRIQRVPEGLVITGEIVTVAPHPFPSRQEYRATLTERWRPTGLDVHWHVGSRAVVATHRADTGTWRVRIEYGGEVREQHGDYPEFCEVDFGTPLFNAAVLARRDFQVDGEHDFPVLRIGPPFMAVTPDRMIYRCAERGRRDTPAGVVDARRYVVSIPGREGEDWTFWADEEGFVIESFEGLDPSRPWMRLVEFRRGS